MSVDKVLVEYDADISKFKSELNSIEANLKKVDASTKKSTDTTKKGFDDASKSIEGATNKLKAQNQVYQDTVKGASIIQQQIQRTATGFNSLNNSINQLTRELPAFTYSAQTGFLAISNNIPTLADAIGGLRKQNLALAAEGQPTVSVLKSLAGAFFSWGTALSVGVTLLTVFGGKISDFIVGIFDSTKAINEQTEAFKNISKQIRENNKASAELFEQSLKSTAARLVSENKITEAQEKIFNLERERDLKRIELKRSFLLQDKKLQDGADVSTRKGLDEFIQGNIDLKKSQHTRLLQLETIYNEKIKEVRTEAEKTALEADKKAQEDIYKQRKAFSDLKIKMMLDEWEEDERISNEKKKSREKEQDDQVKKNIELNKRNILSITEVEKEEKRIKDAKERDQKELRDKALKDQKDLRDKQIAEAQAVSQVLSSLNEAAFNDELNNLNSLFNQKNISEEEYNNRVKKAQQEKAKRDKDIAIFNAIINTASAVLKAAPDTVLMALSAAAGVAQIAVIESQQVPKFARGTKYLERGNNRPGIDTIPVFANEGEAIIPTAINRKHKDIVGAMFDGNLNDLIIQKYVAPALIAQKRKFEEHQSDSFAKNIANSLKYHSEFSDYNIVKKLDRMTDVSRQNTVYLGKVIRSSNNKRTP